MNSKILILVCILITLLSTLSGCTEQNNTPQLNPNDILYVGATHADYPTIQEAINAAKPNATIIVKPGVYNERIDINKTVSIIGENKNTSIIYFNPSDSITEVSIIYINAENCRLENITVTLGVPLIAVQGIKINSKNTTIKNMVITNFTDALELTAYSESNTILYNSLINNFNGINGLNTEDNTIANNTILHNTQYGIHLGTDSDSNVIAYNIVNGSNYGIRIKGSTLNYIYNNCITHSKTNGIYFCCGSRQNRCYNNTFINNSKNAYESPGLKNIWYFFPSDLGPGNYWDDYNGTDANLDGIGDTPYTIPGATNQDLFPLMTPPLTSCLQ